MAGLTGKKITGGKVGAIIALDPAAFDYNNVNGRVAPTDAWELPRQFQFVFDHKYLSIKSELTLKLFTQMQD